MNYAVIMAGGLGTRFWPLSRQKNAKQFIRLIDNQSFLEHTIDRISHSIPPSHIWIVGSKAQEAQLRDHAKKISSDHLLLEPCGKNTAPCIAWAAFELSKIDTDAIMIILPSDHMITPTEEFNRTIESAVQIAKSQDTLVTIGITPTHPTSAYGYIETNGASPILSVTAFHEKPNPQTAETYIKKGNFYWNSGIFVWKASVILDQIKTHLPDLYHALHIKSSDEIINTYPSLESISIDYAIMEKSAHITTLIPSTFTWSDIGSWTALDDFLPKDSHHNASETTVISHNSSNNIVHAPDKTVALIGIDNLIIVDTPDALLIIPKSHDQDVKAIMGKLPDSLK